MFKNNERSKMLSHGIKLNCKSNPVKCKNVFILANLITLSVSIYLNFFLEKFLSICTWLM